VARKASLRGVLGSGPISQLSGNGNLIKRLSAKLHRAHVFSGDFALNPEEGRTPTGRRLESLRVTDKAFAFLARRVAVVPMVGKRNYSDTWNAE
jgi:hypothetical protein